jgi:hypothetical protein
LAPGFEKPYHRSATLDSSTFDGRGTFSGKPVSSPPQDANSTRPKTQPADPPLHHGRYPDKTVISCTLRRYRNVLLFSHFQKYFCRPHPWFSELCRALLPSCYPVATPAHRFARPCSRTTDAADDLPLNSSRNSRLASPIAHPPSPS